MGYGLRRGRTDVAGAGPDDLVISGAMLANTISGFAVGDTIDLAGFNFSGSTFSFNSGSDVLTVSGAGGGIFTLNFDPNATTDLFTLINDNNGGTDVTLTPQPQPVCFWAGTRIATPDGARAVEELRAGDAVCLADGGVRAVRFAGRQTIARDGADAVTVLPVCIAAGALGEGLPKRDLILSPGHALRIGDVLVQAGALVNGGSIRRLAREEVPAVFTYYHLELAEHALLLAEGVAAESYLEALDPVVFDNDSERTADGAMMAKMDYPRAKSARQVPIAIRTRVAAHAPATAPSPPAISPNRPIPPSAAAPPVCRPAASQSPAGR